MTAVQLNAMNTELWQGIGAIADSEPMMKRLTRYVKKLVKEKNEDAALMTEEEFLSRVDNANKGPLYELEAGETIEDLIARIG